MIYNACNVSIRDLPDMYAPGYVALGLGASISGKCIMAMLQLLHIPLLTPKSKGSGCGVAYISRHIS